MVIRSRENSVGAWAFLIGVILAVIIGLGTSSFLSISGIIQYSPQIYAILVVLGLVVGFSIKITDRESQTFMVAGAILVVVSKFGMDSVTGSLIGIGVGKIVSTIFVALLALFVPATIIVALKTVFSISRV
ncbi:MAG TPA: hypothetical protein VJH65_01215 [Candidatus Nanoarchaeia archaeon]|nr:hypothetical protein [Candidatus Nanoarchaeia archaeon]